MAAIITPDQADGHIRWGENMEKWLDGYQFCCSYRMTGRNHIHLFAACGKFSLATHRDLLALFKAKWFEKATWERVVDGELVFHEFIIPQ